MIRLKAKYEEAARLRKRGFTYTEIAKIVDISVSTVSNWLAHETWSKDMRDRNLDRAARENSKRISLLNKARGNQYKKLYAEAERSAVTEFRHYKRDSLFIAGLMLYVSEGDTTHERLIRLSDGRMEIHRIFLRFAREYLGVSMKQVRFWILLYPDLREKQCVQTWMKHLKLTSENFHKNQVIQGRSKKRTLQYGVGNTIIGSAVLKRKLMKWIELSLKTLEKSGHG